MTNDDGTPSNAWSAFFRQLLKSFGGSVVTYPITIPNGGTGQQNQQGAITALTGTQSSGTYLRSDGTKSQLSPLGAADITGAVSVANGGTGQITQQAAIDALSGAQVSGKYLRSDGTHTTLSSIVSADLPTTISANTTGSSANVTGTVTIGNGGTGKTTANAALNAFLPSQTGKSGDFLTTDGTNASWSSAGIFPGSYYVSVYYPASSYYWTAISTTFADMTPQGTIPTPTVISSANFGTISKATSSQAGINFSAPRTGVIKITAMPSVFYPNSSNQTLALQLVETSGSALIASASGYTAGSANTEIPITMVGYLSVTSGTSYNVTIQAQSSAGGVTIGSVGSTGSQYSIAMEYIT